MLRQSILRRTADVQSELSTYIKPFNTSEYDAFGADTNFSGGILISASAFESSDGSGIDPAPTCTRANSGAVYVFQ